MTVFCRILSNLLKIEYWIVIVSFVRKWRRFFLFYFHRNLKRKQKKNQSDIYLWSISLLLPAFPPILVSSVRDIEAVLMIDANDSSIFCPSSSLFSKKLSVYISSNRNILLDWFALAYTCHPHWRKTWPCDPLHTHTVEGWGGWRNERDGISITKIKQLRASSFRNATLLYVTQQRIALMRYGLMNKTSMKGSENPAPLSNWTGEFLSLEFDAIFSFSFLTSLNPIRISFKSLTSFKFRPIDLYESWLNNWMNHRVYKNGVHHIDDVWNDFPLFVWSSCAVCGVGVGTQVAHFRWHAK